jgi:hypothetical protein
VPLTLWILGVAALVAFSVWLHRQRQRARHDSRLAADRRRSAADQAELDRRDCQALEASLLAGAYGERSRPASKPGE